jgi:hypothetical protein
LPVRSLDNLLGVRIPSTAAPLAVSQCGTIGIAPAIPYSAEPVSGLKAVVLRMVRFSSTFSKRKVVMRFNRLVRDSETQFTKNGSKHVQIPLEEEK